MKRKAKKKKVKTSVSCPLNGTNVKVSFRAGAGGNFEWRKNGGVNIQIGRKAAWPNVVGVLIHEVMEALTALLDLRFSSVDTHSVDLGGVLLILTHAQFTSVCRDVGSFISKVLPDVMQMYEAQTDRKAVVE